jgi:hypothetical protein
MSFPTFAQRETAPMPASPAQIASNRRNSLLSSGPSELGKQNSKRNGLKHGLTGEGIVLSREEEAEVASLRDELQAEMRPKTKLGQRLLDQLASRFVRLDKCKKRESAATANRVRNSGFAFEDARRAEVEALFAQLDADPVDAVRKLIRTVEGTLRLIQALTGLRDKLTRTDRGTWNQYNHDRLERCAGRETPPFGSLLFRLTRAITGDLSGLEPHEGAELDDAARKAWAVEQMLERIDVELAVHQAHLETFDPNLPAIERAEAADLALFDPSNEATLLRRYEAAAERSLFRTLKEFHKAEGEATEEAASDATTEAPETCKELASSFPEDVETKPAPSPRPKRVETESPEPSSELDYDARRAKARERERRASR